MTTASSVTVSNGTLDTSSVGNYGITSQRLLTAASSSAILNLNASTITLTSGSTTPVSIASASILNAGTSQINVPLTATPLAFAGGGKTFYNVAFNGIPLTTQSLQITGQNTFNNLSFAASSGTVYRNVTFDANQTINGTFSTTGTAGNRRIFFASANVGIQRDLIINATPSLTDADFRDLRVTGTASPISGTRIGNQTGCSGITFSTPKTVYWNLAAGGNWTATAWAAASGGGVSTDNFPLPQDTAIIENTGLNTSATVTVDINLAIGTLDISSRTTAMTFAFGSTTPTLYGDLKFSTSITVSGTNIITFGGRNTQRITSAGRRIGSNSITIDSPGGVVELTDALDILVSGLTVTNGTFDTKNFNMTAGSIISSNSNVRTINLGSSTVTLTAASGTDFTTTTNLTFNPGTSLIVFSASSTATILVGGGLTFYDVSFTGTASGIAATITGNNTYRNLSFIAPAAVGLPTYIFSGNSTVTGTLTCAGATAVRRLFLRSNTLGTTRTFTVNSLNATDCDFRDITIAGAAAGSSPTRAGDCGGNSGITFPTAKTVYWNLAGSQDWSATAWAPGSGGTPDINNFPLAQDTAVFDNAGAITAVATNAAWNIGTVNMSGRTTAMAWRSNISASYYGDWLFGTGVTSDSNSGQMAFIGRGTQTITSNGVTFNNPVGIDGITGTVQLADALILGSIRTLTFTSGTFNAVTYNVTSGAFSSSNSNTRALRMGTGLWTLTSTGSVWSIGSTNLDFDKNTADILLSNTTTSSRTFSGGALPYNKLTIGGATGTSTLSINDNNNYFGELASTKTVAHTIDFGSTVQNFGKWTVTGTAGNVVTLTGTSPNHMLSGAATSGIDYLAMGSIGFNGSTGLGGTYFSPGEFYAGPNSTGTVSNSATFRTAPPTPRTLYWVGGTGNWSDTARWSLGSGGAGGQALPTSLDNVIFNSASNATAYTATIDTTVRCKSITITGPASGNITLAGTGQLIVHDQLTYPATGMTRTHSGNITLSGTGSGKVITTNGLSIPIVNVRGYNAEWSFGSAITSGGLEISFGTLNTANYNFTGEYLTAINYVLSVYTLNLGSSVITLSGFSTPINFGTTYTQGITRNFNAGTSSITCNFFTGGASFNGNGKTFNNVTIAQASSTSIFGNNLRGNNTFNNLTITTSTTAGIHNVTLHNDQIVTGTFSVSGNNISARRFLLSNTIGTPRTVTAATITANNCDFRDITISGAASPISPSGAGDCGGNTNITFPAAKTVYWNLVAGGDWSATAWATGSLGTPNVNNFPLAQDTAIIENAGLNTSTTITLDANWHIGTINMSTRTNAMTLATGTLVPTIYGDWTFGTGVTTTGTGIITFAKRGTQTITSNGRSFTQPITIDSFNGTVQLADAFVSSVLFSLTSGTFDAVSYNVNSNGFSSSNSNTRTLSMGSGLWTITGSGTMWNTATTTGLTFNKGAANIITTAASSSSTFAGGGLAYNKLTIAGGTNTFSFVISGNNTFTEIASTRTVAYQITLTTTTQRVGAFTVSGSAGNLITISGTSAGAFATLIFTGSPFINVDYIIPTFLKVYDINSDWYAGNNSINGGSYGWIFAVGVVIIEVVNGQFFAFF